MIRHKTFIDLARELKASVTLRSQGNLDPTKRTAKLVFEFSGEKSFEKAQELHIAFVAEVSRRASR